MLPPQALVRVQPDFSKLGPAGRAGTTIAEALVSARGDVTSVRVLRSAGSKVDAVVVEALKGWKFQPGTLNGQPVPVYFTMTVSFHPR